MSKVALVLLCFSSVSNARRVQHQTAQPQVQDGAQALEALLLASSPAARPNPFAQRSVARGFATSRAPVMQETEVVDVQFDESTEEGNLAAALWTLVGKNYKPAYEKLSGIREVLTTTEGDDSLTVAEIFANPEYAEESKRAIIQDLCEEFECDTMMANFLNDLLDNDEAELLPQIADKFEELYKQAEGIIEGTIITATALSKGAEKKMHSVLLEKEFPGKSLTLNFEVDPSIGEGFKFISPAKNMDKTWKTFAQSFMQMIDDEDDK